MGLIEKIENLINMLLIKLSELMYKFVPAPIKRVIEKIQSWFAFLGVQFKLLPSYAKTFILFLIGKVKSTLATVDFKAIFVDSYKKALAQYKEKSSGKTNKFKTIFMAPVLVVGQWLQGLTASQSMLLLAFTSASFLAAIGIGFSGNRLASHHLESNRAPASVKEEVSYDRPSYYKKQTKHFEINNLRLPVYVAQVNEIRSVDIDFTATTSNRNARMFLEKKEFQLRDHLILQIEPSVASFPLEEEGKEIIRRKLLVEINDFLKLHNVEGEITELKITYVLAN